MTRGTTRITKAQVCAGSYLHGTAPGDSGGPLQAVGTDGRWYQIGITSFGANDEKAMLDQGTYPGVYTRVSAYLTWINDTTDYLLPFSSSSNGISNWGWTSFIVIFILCNFIMMR
uniref:Peptidase S1 domain-containing protein n=1 Tax=Plectus sambesii TaxID=2011161 RepID=A0A914UI94_9BILA